MGAGYCCGVGAARAQIAQLQEQFRAEQAAAQSLVTAYEAKVRELEADAAAKAQWAIDTGQRLTAALD